MIVLVRALVVLLLTSVAACSDDEGTSSDTGSTGTSASGYADPAPAPGPGPTPPSAPSPPLGLVQQYSIPPDTATCNAGHMSPAARDEVLVSVNTIRALHDLPAVTYQVADEPEAMAASLIMTASGSSRTRPPPRCLATAISVPAVPAAPTSTADRRARSPCSSPTIRSSPAG